MRISNVFVFSLLVFVSCFLLQSKVLLRQCYGLSTTGICGDEPTPEDPFFGWQWAFSIIDGEDMIYAVLDNSELYSRFANRFAKENGYTSPQFYVDKGLSQDEVDWILNDAGVSLGDAYILYVPESNKYIKCHVVSVTVGRSGTGVPLEIFYLVLRPDAPLHSRVGRPIGIINAEELGSPPKPDITLIDPQDQRYVNILAFVKETTEKGDGQIELDDYAFLYDKVNAAILYNLKTEGLIRLGCLVSKNGLWKQSAFSGDIRIENGMVPIEEENVEHDLGMYETAYTILNDINGNGFAEVYVKSTISYIFEFDSNGRLLLRMSFYNGP